MSYLRRSGTPCFTSAVVIANVYYVLSKLENPRYALDKVRRLRKLVAVASVTEAVIDAALSSSQKDFEDAIQIQCALQNDIPILLTRNVRDYPKDRLRITDPLQYLHAAALFERGSILRTIHLQQDTYAGTKDLFLDMP